MDCCPGLSHRVHDGGDAAGDPDQRHQDSMRTPLVKLTDMIVDLGVRDKEMMMIDHILRTILREMHQLRIRENR